MKKTKHEILGVKAPKKACTDRNCPFHGQLGVKKSTVTGTVYKKDAHHSATIEWKRSQYVPKYERYEMRRSRLRVHNPACINAEVGQEVVAARTRPISKMKNHIIIQIVKKEHKEKKQKTVEKKKPLRENESSQS